MSKPYHHALYNNMAHIFVSANANEHVWGLCRFPHSAALLEI